MGDKYDVEMMVDVSSEIALKESDDPRVISLSEFDAFYGTGLLNWTAKDLSEDNILRIENECKSIMMAKNRGRAATRRRRDRSRSRSRSNSPDSSSDAKADFKNGSSLSHRALFYALKGVDSPSDSRKRMHRDVNKISKLLGSLRISKASSASLRD